MTTPPTLYSAWVADTGQTRQDTRLSPIGTFTPTASPLASLSGVVPGSNDGSTLLSGFNVVGTSAMKVTVYAGRAVIQGLDTQGAYSVAANTSVEFTIEDGNPQYPRIDLIVLHVYDAQVDSFGRNEAVIEVIKGAEDSATPVVPAVPDRALALYKITVPKGASAGEGGIPWSSALVDLRTATVGLGGILPTTAGGPQGAYPGQYRDVYDSTGNGHLERWNGSAWTRYSAFPDPVWKSWTPTWSTTTGKALPSWGDATISCRYVQLGPVVHFSFDVSFGAGTKFGTSPAVEDNWSFSLPVPSAGSNQTIGTAALWGSGQSAGYRVMAHIRCLNSKLMGMEVATGMPNYTALNGTGLADATTPFAWAAEDAIHGFGTYEAAV
ncbi:hypothetical protein [Actinacidiphila yeochonensis]|uniref:hypothetical protein n=1 Tax=Actinacidiphila yeochonensis TaxID=89050 RepID=UPI000689C931|nr:hypothetical protein [Actinacidiphila yeochonensis]